MYEYQAKRVLARCGVAIPQGVVVHTADEARHVALPAVLKSQVLAGGRGKAGGVQVVNDTNQLLPAYQRIMATPIKGQLPQVILAEERLPIEREFYLSILIDRANQRLEMLAHAQGGVEVEALDQGSFLRRAIDGDRVASLADELAATYQLPGRQAELAALLQQLLVAVQAQDATLLEINPLVLTATGALIAADCKLVVDDAARFRHPEWLAAQAEHNFVEMNRAGSVATIANGAGLAMATVDAVEAAGLQPANFLDIGGGATSQQVLAAFQRLMEFPHLQAIVINIFAGITRSDEVAQAIITARRRMAGLPPLFVRLEGTNAAQARELLAAAGLVLYPHLPAAIAAVARAVQRSDHE